MKLLTSLYKMRFPSGHEWNVKKLTVTIEDKHRQWLDSNSIMISILNSDDPEDIKRILKSAIENAFEPRIMGEDEEFIISLIQGTWNVKTANQRSCQFSENSQKPKLKFCSSFMLQTFLKFVFFEISSTSHNISRRSGIQRRTRCPCFLRDGR